MGCVSSIAELFTKLKLDEKEEELFARLRDGYSYWDLRQIVCFARFERALYSTKVEEMVRLCNEEMRYTGSAHGWRTLHRHVVAACKVRWDAIGSYAEFWARVGEGCATAKSVVFEEFRGFECVQRVKFVHELLVRKFVDRAMIRDAFLKNQDEKRAAGVFLCWFYDKMEPRVDEKTQQALFANDKLFARVKGVISDQRALDQARERDLPLKLIYQMIKENDQKGIEQECRGGSGSRGLWDIKDRFIPSPYTVNPVLFHGIRVQREKQSLLSLLEYAALCGSFECYDELYSTKRGPLDAKTAEISALRVRVAQVYGGRIRKAQGEGEEAYFTGDMGMVEYQTLINLHRFGEKEFGYFIRNKKVEPKWVDAMMVAADANNVEALLRFLNYGLQKGVDVVNVVGAGGSVLLSRALQADSLEVVKIVGTNTNLRMRANEFTLLQHLEQSDKPKTESTEFMIGRYHQYQKVFV